MITIIFRSKEKSGWNETVVANSDDALELLYAFEGTDRIGSYTIMDPDYRVNGVTSVDTYGWAPEAFPKFIPWTDF